MHSPLWEAGWYRGQSPAPSQEGGIFHSLGCDTLDQPASLARLVALELQAGGRPLKPEPASPHSPTPSSATLCMILSLPSLTSAASGPDAD